MSSSLGNIFSGLLIFMTGVAFTYYSFPFMSSFLSAFNTIGSAWSGWEIIQYIIWGGYWLIVVLWLLVFPLMKVTGQEKIQL